MRNHWIAAVAVMALLGGCSSADQNTSAQPAQPAIAPGTTITGTVTLHDPIPIGAGAKLDIKLNDAAQSEIAIAEKTVEVSGQPPFNFSLDFDPKRISAERTYEIKAILTDDQRRFVQSLSAPVLTHKATTIAQVILTAEATPAEKLKEEFSKLQGRIGAMKQVNGTYMTDKASVAWDAFGESGAIRFVRVNTMLDAGGRSAVYYTFSKDGNPIIAKQKDGAMVGWNDNDEVLINERPGGGGFSDNEVKSLHDDAQKAYQLAQDKFDAANKKK
jgi:putative lipoprotein